MLFNYLLSEVSRNSRYRIILQASVLRWYVCILRYTCLVLTDYISVHLSEGHFFSPVKCPLFSRDPEQITAANVVAHLDEDSLYKVLKYYGEESNARILARALVESRYLFHRLDTTQELANLVASLVEGERRTDRLGRHAHPATKTFQVGQLGCGALKITLLFVSWFSFIFHCTLLTTLLNV